jgi:hypothetical protein
MGVYPLFSAYTDGMRFILFSLSRNLDRKLLEMLASTVLTEKCALRCFFFSLFRRAESKFIAISSLPHKKVLTRVVNHINFTASLQEVPLCPAVSLSHQAELMSHTKYITFNSFIA